MYPTIGSNEYEWAGRSAKEILEVAERHGSILVVPVGSVEQHGNHLPVATDTILVDAVVHEGARRVTEEIPILVTPPVWHGYSPHHLPFGGTITLEFDDLLAIIEDISESALDNGFDSLLLVNGHGGNISLINSAVKTIGEGTKNSTIHGLTYFHLARRFIDDIRESDLGGMSHGGEFETSLMLHLRPDLVKTDVIEGTPRKRVFEHESKDLMEGGELSTYRSFDEYSSSGAVGKPELASSAKGEEIFDRLGSEMRTLLMEIHGQHRENYSQ